MNTFPLQSIPTPPKDNRPMATFLIMLIIALCCLGMVFLCGCQHTSAKRLNSPDLAAAVGQNKGIFTGITSAQSDNKEIKRAVGRLKGGNESLRQSNTDILGNLDRADYKIQRLLQK